MVEKEVAISILEDIKQDIIKDKSKGLRTIDIYVRNLEVATSPKIKELVAKKKELVAKYGEDDKRVEKINKKASAEINKLFDKKESL